MILTKLYLLQLRPKGLVNEPQLAFLKESAFKGGGRMTLFEDWISKLMPLGFTFISQDVHMQYFDESFI